MSCTSLYAIPIFPVEKMKSAVVVLAVLPLVATVVVAPERLIQRQWESDTVAEASDADAASDSTYV